MRIRGPGAVRGTGEWGASCERESERRAERLARCYRKSITAFDSLARCETRAFKHTHRQSPQRGRREWHRHNDAGPTAEGTKAPVCVFTWVSSFSLHIAPILKILRLLRG